MDRTWDPLYPVSAAEQSWLHLKTIILIPNVVFPYEKTLKWFWWFRSFLTHQCLLLSEASATITCLFVNKHNLCFPINAKRSHRRGFNSAGALVYPWENNILHHANKNKNTITNISTNTTMNTNASTSSYVTTKRMDFLVFSRQWVFFLKGLEHRTLH